MLFNWAGNPPILPIPPWGSRPHHFCLMDYISLLYLLTCLLTYLLTYLIHGPWTNVSQTLLATRLIQPFFYTAHSYNQQTDIQTDHATCDIGSSGAHSMWAKDQRTSIVKPKTFISTSIQRVNIHTYACNTIHRIHTQLRYRKLSETNTYSF